MDVALDIRQAMAADAPGDGHTMQCMEVWGGNEAADSNARMPGLDVWVYSRPYQGDRGGGDVHYVSRCGTGRIARILLADVSGHGSTVNDIAVSLRTLMRKYVNFLDQTKFVEMLNREFFGSVGSGLFATALIGTYWAPTQYLVTSNAGHPPPMRYRADVRRWELLESTEPAAGPGGVQENPSNLPLGIFDPTTYDQFGVRLRRDDLVLLYTDSLIEAQNADGTLLGTAGLLDVLNSLDGTRPETLIPSVLGKVRAFAGSEDLGDDATAILLRNTATGAPRMGVRETANAAWLFLGLLVGRLMGSNVPVPWPEISVENLGGPLWSRLNLRWGRTEGRMTRG